MKKYIFAVAILSIVPSVAFASWWNPTTWFSPTNTNSSSTISTTDQQLLDRVNELQQEVNQEQSQKVSTTTQPVIPSTTDHLKTQTNINSLTAENSTLESKVSNLQTELQTVQSNYNICQKSLKIAQNQAQQSNATATSQTNQLDSAVLSLDPQNPNSSAGARNGQVSALLLAFDIKPSSADQFISSLTVDINTSIPANISNVGTVSLYSGNPNIPNSGASVIATTPIVNGVVKFTNIQNISSIEKSIVVPLRFPSASFNTFSIGVNMSGLDHNDNGTISASVSNINIINSDGQNVTVTGTAQGNQIDVTNYNTVP